MKIFFTISDNGDGSSSVMFFDSQECIDILEERDPEGFGQGVGGDFFEVDGPITCINIRTMSWVNKYLAGMGL